MMIEAMEADMAHVNVDVQKEIMTMKDPGSSFDARWLEENRRVGHALEKFWDGIRGMVWEHYSRLGFKDNQQDFLLGVISYHKSAEYHQKVQQDEAKVLSDEYASNSGFASGQENLSGDKIVQMRPKEAKKKRRFEGKSTKNATVEIPVERNTSEAEARHASTATKIQLSKKNLHTLQQLYPVDRQEGKESVNWDDFVRAMIEAGFTVQNGGSAAVIFEYTGEGGGRIVFHKPHPEGKLDPIMLRIAGKRMAKWFNWNRESLVRRA